MSTTAELDGDQWVINGQKVWTSMAHLSQWCFVVARTEKGSKRHAGLSYLLVPLDQPGVEIRPIVQLTGTADFNEVFFDDARTDADLVVGEPGDGWRVAMGTLTFERGVSTLGQQIRYARELSNLVELAKRTGAADDPLIRERLTRSWVGLQTMRSYALATMDVEQPGPGQRLEAVVGQLASRPRRAGDGRRRARPGWWPRTASSTSGSTCTCSRAGHHLRRVQRDPAQHHRRAGARPTPGGQGMSLAEAPKEIEGHGLLNGKVVVVTAAAGTGIGSAVARRALAEGADVVVSDHHERRLGETRDQLAELGLGRVESVVCDVTSTAQVDALISSTTARMGRLDVLVNNAGLGGQTPVVDMTDEEWDRVLNVTLTSVMRATRAALRYFRDADHGGVIVNNASVLGWRAQHSQSHYAAAKAGVMALTRCSAIEAVEYGVRINAVSPSIARHKFLEKTSSSDLLDRLSEGEAFGRAAEPWEVAATIAFLASDYSSYLTGEVISVSSQHP